MKAAVLVAAGVLGLTHFPSSDYAPPPDLASTSVVATEAANLRANCGPVRAQSIAQMDYARGLHILWEGEVARHPEEAATVGSVEWHRYWVTAYDQAIGLLRADCRR